MEESRKLREEFEMILNSKIKREENLLVDLFQFFFKKRRSKVLYRYRNFDEKDHNLNSLRNDRMYFSNPDSFNDPHDSLVFINSKKVDEENIKRLISEKKIIDQKKQLANIACLSEGFDSTLMWAHYADNHKGFVLEYNLDKLKTDPSLMICPVIYSDNRFDSTDFYIDFIKKFNTTYKASKNLDLLQLIKPFVYKSYNWEYEKEWRVIQNHKSEADRIEPNKPFYVNIKPTAIFMGDKISEKNQGLLNQISKEKKIPIYKMFVDYSSREYKLDYKEVLKNY